MTIADPDERWKACIRCWTTAFLQDTQQTVGKVTDLQSCLRRWGVNKRSPAEAGGDPGGLKAADPQHHTSTELSPVRQWCLQPDGGPHPGAVWTIWGNCSLPPRACLSSLLLRGAGQCHEHLNMAPPGGPGGSLSFQRCQTSLDASQTFLVSQGVWTTRLRKALEGQPEVGKQPCTAGGLLPPPTVWFF